MNALVGKTTTDHFAIKVIEFINKKIFISAVSWRWLLKFVCLCQSRPWKVASGLATNGDERQLAKRSSANWRSLRLAPHKMQLRTFLLLAGVFLLDAQPAEQINMKLPKFIAKLFNRNREAKLKENDGNQWRLDMFKDIDYSKFNRDRSYWNESRRNNEDFTGKLVK